MITDSWHALQIQSLLCQAVNIKFLVCFIVSHIYHHFDSGFFFIVHYLIYVFSIVVSGTFAPSSCIMSSVFHHSASVHHPSVSVLWLLPPSLFRSTEQWAYGSWAIWARPAVPPPPLIPSQTASHRIAGRQRQVNIQRNKGQTC